MEQDREPQESQGGRELRLATANALKLGASLAITWGIGLAVRFALPRALGPAGFGAYNFADTYAASWFVFLSLGVESLIQKDAATDPGLVSRIGGGVMLVRSLLSLVVLALALTTLGASGRSDAMLLMTYFALGQIAIYDSGFLGAAMQAAGTVGGLSILNVGTKLLWGGWIFGCMALGSSAHAMAAGYAVAEIARAVALHALARRALDFRVQVDLRATRLAIIAALPLYLNAVMIILSNKLNVSLLSFLVGSDDEVGYFSAALTLAGIALLFTPVVVGVVAPMLNRTLARDRDEFFSLVGRVTMAIIQLTVPVTLTLYLGAELWVRLAFGAEYLPAAKSLRCIAPMFSLTYLAIIFAISLNAMGLGWKTIRISVFGIATSVGVTVLITRPSLVYFGPGGGGAGAGLGALTMELVTAATYLWVFDRKVLSGRLVRSSLLAFAAAGAAGVLHAYTESLPSIPRLALALALYTALVFLTRAVAPTDLRALFALVRKPRGKRASAPGR